MNDKNSTFLETGRIDLFENDNGLRVMKWPLDWVPGTQPVISYLNNQITLDFAVEQLKIKGWTVRRWHKGARAWNGPLRPIRTKGQITNKREQFTRHPRPGIQLCTVDFAYDC